MPTKRSFVPHVYGPTSGPSDEPMSITFFDDFIGATLTETAEGSLWLGAGTGATASLDSATGGQATCITGTSDNDVYCIQVQGEAFKLNSSSQMEFRCRFKIDDVDLTDWCVGMMITDADPLAAVSDFIGFGQTDATNFTDIMCANGINASAESWDQTAGTNSVLTNSGADIADDTFVTVSFVADTDKILYYVDGSLVATHETLLPTDEHLTPTLALRNCDGNARILTVDYVFCTQPRF